MHRQSIFVGLADPHFFREDAPYDTPKLVPWPAELAEIWGNRLVLYKIGAESRSGWPDCSDQRRQIAFWMGWFASIESNQPEVANAVASVPFSMGTALHGGA